MKPEEQRGFLLNVMGLTEEEMAEVERIGEERRREEERTRERRDERK